jgi:ribosomal protein L30/L7E
MHTDTVDSADRSNVQGATTRYGKLRFLTLADIDKRTVAYRETTRIMEEIESDLGGPEQLSAGERQLVQRAGVLGAVLSDIEARWIRGEPLDPGSYCTIINAQRRVLEGLGLRRRPKDVTPSVRDYLHHVGEAAE